MVGKKTVLVIDDMPANLQIIKAILEDTYTVRLARSGALAKSLFDSVDVDLILLDLEMPGESGFEYMQWLKRNPATKKIPVLFVSSHTEPEIVKYAAQLDVKGYIRKPVEPEMLRERVRAALA